MTKLATAVKERPILFSGEMVRAILDGCKTQTRRVVKNQPPSDAYTAEYVTDAMQYTGWRYRDGWATEEISCPYGVPGDRLWVRERWRVVAWHNGSPIEIQFQDGTCREATEDFSAEYDDWAERMVWQSATDCRRSGLDLDSGEYQFDIDECPTRWRPSIHMPRWASRINLEITDVRIERVQDITESDAKAEGLLGRDNPFARGKLYTHEFAKLWDELNAKRGYSWESNPWVWVLAFKKLK